MSIVNGILRLSRGIQLRGGTLASLASENPVLLSREIMIETDTGKIKIGDGVTAWNSLSYFNDLGLYIDSDGDIAQIDPSAGVGEDAEEEIAVLLTEATGQAILTEINRHNTVLTTILASMPSSESE